MTRKRVAVLLSGFGVVNRGAEKFLGGLMAKLDAEYDFVVLSRAPSSGQVAHIEAVSRDNRVLRLLVAVPLLGYLLKRLDLDPLNVEWLTAARAGRHWLMTEQFDLLIAEGGRWCAALGREVQQERGIPVIDICHGAIGRWEIAAARNLPDRYVASTEAAKQEVLRHIPGLNVTVIPMAVDTGLFNPSVSPMQLDLARPVFVAVGEVEKMKRFHLVVKAIEQLGRGSLVVVGDGPLADRIDRLAEQRLGSLRYRRMRLATEGMPALYTAADVMTLASETESFGLAYLEAMAANLPVVTQSDSTRREVVGDGGLLCDCADIGSYAGALAQAVAQDWGNKPRLNAEKYDWKLVAERYRGLFTELTG